MDAISGTSAMNGESGSWKKLGDAAQMLGVSEITLRRRVKAGKVQHEFKSGKYFVFVPEDLDKENFLNSGSENELAKPVQRKSSMERAGQAKDLLKPYALKEQGFQKKQTPQSDILELKAEMTSLKTDLLKLKSENLELKSKLADQETLNAALELAYEEAISEL